MKKFATVLLSICLIFTMCISSFAAVPDLSYSSSVSTQVREISEDLGSAPTDEQLTQAAEEIITVLKDNGAKSGNDLRESVDILYNKGFIDQALYNKLCAMIKETQDEENGSTQDILDQMSAIVENDALSFTEKATAIFDLIKDLPAEEAQKILDSALNAGIIDNDIYNAISDLFNGNDIDLGGLDSITGGIGDLVDTILGMLGIGGSDSGDSNDGSGSSSTGSTTNRTDFEGGNAKTGDYAVASVAGVALVAGAALLLTRKKK